jgi:hypothetical protein
MMPNDHRGEPLPPEDGAYWRKDPQTGAQALILIDGGMVQRLVSVGPLLRAGALNGDLSGPLRKPESVLTFPTRSPAPKFRGPA